MRFSPGYAGLLAFLTHYVKGGGRCREEGRIVNNPNDDTPDHDSIEGGGRKAEAKTKNAEDNEEVREG